jgi:hypothetical protein
MNKQEARVLGGRIAPLVQAGNVRQAYALLAQVLAERTPFPVLGCIGQVVGTGPPSQVDRFLEHIASEGTEGGWVVLAMALSARLERDLSGAFDRCRRYVIVADVWYATDILGERVPGPALVTQFELGLELLAPWREDCNRWVRRTAGVAAHFWAKRAQGVQGLALKAAALLEFLEPMWSERDMDAVKGIGWGLKTLGRYYPDVLAEWLLPQVASGRPYRALMLRKALTYLPRIQRDRVARGVL